MPTNINENEKQGTLFLRGLPPALKRSFKVLCTLRGMTMTKRIEELMRTDIKTKSQKENQ